MLYECGMRCHECTPSSAPLALCKTVVVVDTKNEIGGDGVIPHKDAIGDSRRIMVPNDTEQHR